MSSTNTELPHLPDLTHPQELLQFGTQLLTLFLIVLVLLGSLGLVIALLSWSVRHAVPEPARIIEPWISRYSRLLSFFQHSSLILILIVGGFFLCTTLANRYHNWEQDNIAKIAAQVAGDRLEQPSPQIRYTFQEPYTYDTPVDGKIVRVKNKRTVNRYLNLESSQIQVQLDQATNAQNNQATYQVDFNATYQVTNPLKETQDFWFEVAPPQGYLLLRNFSVEESTTGQRLTSIAPDDYAFPFELEPGNTTTFRVTYQAQGGPRWVYNAGGQLLSNFKLTVLAKFANADFASGIVPTESQPEAQGTRFTWQFKNNVSVQNPFGVFTSTRKVENTGILPRLLLLAPGILLWWLLLLTLSLPLRAKDLTIAAGLFFSLLLALTYLSRLFPAPQVWGILCLLTLPMAWGLGRTYQGGWAAMICTLSGLMIPVFGLLIPYSGLTLSLAGLLSLFWLTLHHWYGLGSLPRNEA